MVKELTNINYIIRTQTIKNNNIKNNKNEILNNELFKENNIKKYCLNKQLYINNVLLIIIFLINFFPLCHSDKLKLNKIIEIEIAIKGNGNQNILSNSYNYELPNEVFVNGTVYNNYKNKTIFNLTNGESYIKMRWNTSITNFSRMFFNLYNITKIKFVNFYASKMNDMSYMLSECSSLLSINFINFDTSLVNNMSSLFSNCKSLISLNLNNFNTSLVTKMTNMFSGCSSLKCLNINNFNTSLVTYMISMFSGCSSLIYLDLNNFNTSLVTSMNSMFYGCSSLNCLNLDNFNTSLVTDMRNMFYNCNSLKFLYLNNFDTSLVTEMSFMFKGCNSLIYLNLDNFNTSSVSFKSSMFNDCNNNLIYCINETKAKEITSLLSVFTKNCSYIYHNNFETICNDSSSNNNNSSYYCYFFEDEEKNISYINNSYINNISNINIEIDELFIYCTSNEFYNGECEINTNNIANKDDFINNIKNKLMNGSIDSLISNIIENKKKDIILKDNNILYQITSTYNQNNNKYNNISSIILGECEDILKKEYKIDNNLSLLIFKIDYFKPDSLIPIIGYEIFHPITKEKLNLTFCKDVFINLDIPVFIDENDLFKYDPENQYYKDECYPSTTDNGTDILINDRQNEYNDNNMSICENNCVLKEYDNETRKSNCECNIKSKQLVISELINQTDILSYNFISKSGSFNMITMKCYYTLFTKEGLYKNIGSYILIFTILLIIISSILFYKCGYHLLEDDIKEIIELKENNIKDNIINEINIKETNIINYQKTNKSNKSKKKKYKSKKKKNIENFKDTKNININGHSKSFSNLNINSVHKNVVNKIEKSINSKNNIKIYDDSAFYTDYEINSFSYYEAIKYDKRNYYKYYFSLIKVKHPLLFSFYPIKDYNF